MSKKKLFRFTTVRAAFPRMEIEKIKASDSRVLGFTPPSHTSFGASTIFGKSIQAMLPKLFRKKIVCLTGQLHTSTGVNSRMEHGIAKIMGVHYRGLSVRRDEVKGLIDEVKGEVQRKIDEVEEKVQMKIEDVKNEVKGKFEEVEHKVQGKIDEAMPQADFISQNPSIHL
ncbi:hypothetical protein AVEN_17626-1 [Araneus ventricosus]|uniref:Uncharacterized protein n=1 Tax=Araneus ventricosus TaxID=182803 RepID=A0A4Y2VT93_ARAVE|nr:hypothetical protein AVEN_17626-1 [Araneus ventricosus]